jgi:rsbT co-antagonist protein RsbR
MEPLNLELEELRRRIVELETEVAKQRERADLYQALFEHLPVPALASSEDGTLVEINWHQRRLLAVPSREAVIGMYDIHKDPQAIAQGYVASFDRAVKAPLGEAVRMTPTAYDSAEADYARMEDRRLYTQSSFQPADVDGKRYIVQTNLDVTQQVRAERALEESSAFFRGILERAPVVVDVKDREGRYVLANAPREAMANKQPSDMIGKTDMELFPEGLAAEYMQADREVLEKELPIEREIVCADGCGGRSYVWTKYPLRDIEGRVAFVCSIAMDITERKRAEEEALGLQEKMLAVKDATLRALSTPLLPIAKGVIVLPLVGTVDERRASAVLETLLQGIAQYQAERVIIDVTGVPEVDAEVANALLQTARAVKLLGAEVVLTGLQAGIARTLVDLGADLGDIRTLATLESGISLLLRRRMR